MTLQDNLTLGDLGETLNNDDKFGALLYHHADGLRDDFSHDDVPNYQRAVDNLEGVEVGWNPPQYVSDLKERGGEVGQQMFERSTGPAGYEDLANVVFGPVINKRTKRINKKREVEADSRIGRMLGRTNTEEYTLKYVREEPRPLESVVTASNSRQPAYVAGLDLKNPVNPSQRPAGKDPTVALLGPREHIKKTWESLLERPEEHPEFFKGLFPEQEYPVTNEEIIQDAGTPERTQGSYWEAGNLPREYQVEL